jgi:protein-glutamine gamma-glutamyltransferase
MGAAAAAVGDPLSTRAVDRFFQISLLSMLTAGHLAMVASRALDLPSVIVTCAAIALRFTQVAGWRGLHVSDRAATVAALAYMGFWPLDYLWLSADFVTAMVHLICFLASIMVLRARTSRDYFFVQLIAFLELLTASILHAGPAFFVFLVIFLLSAVATMASGEIRGNVARPQVIARSTFRGFALRLSGLAMFIFVGVLVLTAALFFVLPRTARAAFQHLWSDRYHLPGFANEVLLGQIGEIRKTNTPVMHTRFLTAERPENPRWRGSALVHFDGQRWFNEPEQPERINVNNGLAWLGDAPRQGTRASRYQYEVQVDAISTDTLFLAGNPLSISIDTPFLLRTRTGSYRTGRGLTRGMRYLALGVFANTGGAGDDSIDLPLDARITYITLPNVDKSIIELARRITAPYPDPSDKAAAIEHYLRESFAYTEELPQKQVADPLAHFLFERREGHCEYFASSMAVMLRVVYIPARVVTGFQPGVFNPVSGWNLVRTSDAHSWVEAFLPRRGWVGFDPTPAAPAPDHLSLWGRMMMYLDAAEVFWHDWVVSYDIERQLILAESMGASSRNLSLNWQTRMSAAVAELRVYAAWLWGHAVFLLLSILVAALLVFVAGPWVLRAWRDRRRMESMRQGSATTSDAAILYRRMLDWLARRGVHKTAWQTPNEFLRGISPREEWPLIADLTEAYNEFRFGGRPEAAARMAALLARLESGSGR